jgi:hypothetical protein
MRSPVVLGALVDCEELCREHHAHDASSAEIMSTLLRAIALVQGVFYLATGVWPLLDIDSFQLVTGPKVDLWLVRTVGVLVGVIGTVLLLSVRRRRITPEIAVLAVGSAVGLAGIDLVYALSGKISSIYLADAVVELALAVLWGLAWFRDARAEGP